MRSKPPKALLLSLLVALSTAHQQSSARTKTQDSESSRQQSAPQPSAEEWERYTYPGEEFSAELPGMPFHFETSRRTSHSEAEPMRTFGLYSSGVVYVVTSFDNPRESFDKLASSHWSSRWLKSVRDVKLGGFDGREYESVEGPRAQARVFRAKRHAYIVWAITYGADEPRVARFLDSFALGDNPRGRSIHEPPQSLVTSPKPESRESQQPAQPAQAAQAANAPNKNAGVVRKALIVYKPEPGYTEIARRNNVQGTVKIRAVLASDGRVKNISVVTLLPDGLTELAVNAARHILFLPAEKDGRAASQYVTLEYNFSLY